MEEFTYNTMIFYPCYDDDEYCYTPQLSNEALTYTINDISEFMSIPFSYDDGTTVEHHCTDEQLVLQYAIISPDGLDLVFTDHIVCADYWYPDLMCPP